jgi:hypothetical protein
MHQHVPLSQWMSVVLKERIFLFRHDLQKSQGETSPIQLFPDTREQYSSY